MPSKRANWGCESWSCTRRLRMWLDAGVGVRRGIVLVITITSLPERKATKYFTELEADRSRTLRMMARSREEEMNWRIL